MSHQDWKPVILKKNVPKKRSNYVKTKPDEEMCDKAPSKVSHKLSKQIQMTRSKKNMTQSDLANRCNLSVKVIKAYENGSAIPNNNELNKLRRILGKLTK